MMIELVWLVAANLEDITYLLRCSLQQYDAFRRAFLRVKLLLVVVVVDVWSVEEGQRSPFVLKDNVLDRRGRREE